MTPLDILEQLWGEFGISVPYFDTVNIQVDLEALPTPWASALYQPETTVDVMLGSAPWVEERGQLLVGLVAKSNSGPHALDPQVEEVRKAFHGCYSNGLTIEHVIGPNDPAPDATGMLWVIGLGLRYLYQYQRGA